MYGTGTRFRDGDEIVAVLNETIEELEGSVTENQERAFGDRFSVDSCERGERVLG